MPLTLSDLHAANIARQAEWCPDQVPDLSFRGNELAGETGEACNVIKKLERERQGWAGSRASKDQLAEELADVVICADLCAVTAGIDLDAAVIAKFNATSEKVGMTTRLPAPGGIEALLKAYRTAFIAFGAAPPGSPTEREMRPKAFAAHSTITAALTAREREVASAAYDAGFSASRPRWNGQYPGSAHRYANYKAARSEYLQTLSAGESGKKDQGASPAGSGKKLCECPTWNCALVERRCREEVLAGIETRSQTASALTSDLQTLSPGTSAGEAREAKDPSATVANEILAERRRQMSAEGWTAEHDDLHTDGQIALAAAAYAYGSQFDERMRRIASRPGWWPWDANWWKPTDARRDLVKAAALIVAEIERLDRTPSTGA